MTCLVVSSLSQLAPTAEKHRPQDMITLISPGVPVTRPAMIAADRHLYLSFNDINEARKGLVAPAAAHVTALLDFARSWQQTAPLLIHCHMGISRSTAAAFIIACALNPQMDERLLAAYLRRKAPSATPNARLTGLADHLLDRRGRMDAAIKQIGRGCDAAEGIPFTMEIRPPFCGSECATDRPCRKPA